MIKTFTLLAIVACLVIPSFSTAISGIVSSNLSKTSSSSIKPQSISQGTSEIKTQQATLSPT